MRHRAPTHRWPVVTGMLLALNVCVFDAQADELDALLGSTDSEQTSSDDVSADASGEGSSIAAEDSDAVVEVIPLPRKSPDLPIREAPRSRMIDEIIVTATKREASLREIPQSITAIDGAALEAAGVQTAEEVLKKIPGVSFGSDGIYAARIAVRGVAAGLTENMTTGVLLENMSLTDSYIPLVTLDPNPFDMQSFEVLKGPQGTLFGASALAGAVRLVPQPVLTDQWEAKYFAQYTQVSDGQAKPIFGGAVNMPIGRSDNMGLRLVVIDRTDPGYVDETGRMERDINRFEQQSLRGTFRWKPSSDWDVRLMYVAQDQSSTDTDFTDNREGRLERDNTPWPQPVNTDFKLGGLSIDYEMSWATLTSETSYAIKNGAFLTETARSANGNEAPPTRLDEFAFYGSKAWSQELRLTSIEYENWSWLGGLFLARTRPELDVVLTAGERIDGAGAASITVPLLGTLITPDGAALLGSLAVRSEIDEVALFADVTRKFFDDWELGLGVRAYRTESGGTSDKDGLAFIGTTAFEGSIKEQGVSPKVSLTWHVNDRIMSYALASKGFRIGGIQPGYSLVTAESSAPPFFRSDSLWNYELGLRTEWLDGALWLDATAFLIDWTDTQVKVVDPNDPTALSSFYSNVGEVRSEGIEGAIRWLPPIDGLELNISAAYTDSYTTKPSNPTGSEELPAGTRYPLSPRVQTAASLAYGLELGPWRPAISVSYVNVGEAVNDLSGRQPIYNYEQWDASLSLANSAIRWLPNVTLNVTNLMDIRGIASHQVLSEANDIRYIRPRAVMLRLSGEF